MKINLSVFSLLILAFVFTNNVSAQITYTATGSGTWSSVTWSPTGTPGPSDNVIIPDGDTVTINTNFTINDLTVGGGTSGVLQFSKTDTTNIVVNGNILIQLGGVFKVQTNTNGGTGLLHTLDLKGNLTHYGLILDFRSGTPGTTLSGCNLTLSGTKNSTLAVNTPYSTVNGDFNAVTINKTGGAKVILGSNIAVNGGSSNGPAALNSTMTFISGIIETVNYVWICQSTSSTQVTGYSAASYINGAMGRGMSNNGGTNKDFPVGDANAYEIFNLRSTTSGTATGHYAIVRCISGSASTGSSSFTNGIDKVSDVRYYQVSYNQLLGSGAASMSFDRFRPSYNTNDGVAGGNTNLRVAYSTDSRATWIGMNQTVPHTTTLVSPPTTINPDSLSPVITLASGSNSIYFALARVTGTTDNTLPVELSSFSSTVNGRNVRLNWETKTELNFRNFSIERAIFKMNDASVNWNSIGTVQASGTGSSPMKYSFNDNKLQPGKYQYRLKMLNYDGAFTYSNIIETEIMLPSSFELSQNYPNPFNPSTKINYSLPSDSKVTLEVFNINGERVEMLVNAYQSAGFYTFNFENNRIASGIYFYRLNTIALGSGNSFSSIKKMILLK